MLRIIVEGLDCVGKTTVAEMISTITGLPYIKIKKTVKNSYSEFETTQSIINEISDTIGENWSGVLDRGFHSSVASALIRDYTMDYNRLHLPNNLIGDLGFLVVSSKESILRRNTKPLTYQDNITLSSDKFDDIQSRLITDCKTRGYSLIKNYDLPKEVLYGNLKKQLKTNGVTKLETEKLEIKVDEMYSETQLHENQFKLNIEYSDGSRIYTNPSFSFHAKEYCGKYLVKTILKEENKR
jgi:hypothetical protein